MQDEAATLYATMRPASGGKSLVTLSTYQERQEALKRTTIMEDDTSHRTSRHFTNGTTAASDVIDGYHHQQQHQQQQLQSNQLSIPPPPPQFANSPPKANQANGIYNYQTIKRAVTNGVTTTSQNTTSTKAPKPPSSPIPDYDNQQQTKQEDKRLIQINSLKAVPKQNGTTKTAVPPSPTRRTIRLGAVTIGEYEQQRKEPSKFEFIGNAGQNNVKNFQSELQNTLSRSKLKNGTSNHHQLEHKRDCPLRNGYGVENSTRNQKQSHAGCEGTATVKRNSNGSVYSNGSTGHNGILKNGNSRNSAGGMIGVNGHSSKITEKTITFGN